jgi:hypothetical protein
MAWGINLRSDLAKLSDGELAGELGRLLEYHSSRFGSAPAVGSRRGWWRYGFTWPFGRGHCTRDGRTVFGYGTIGRFVGLWAPSTWSSARSKTFTRKYGVALGGENANINRS